MMNDVYFDNVIQIGKLYLDHIFYEFESEPILFSCTDDKRNIYLCLCSEIRYGQRWVVTKCSITKIKDLIDQKIDIASVFLSSPNIIAIDMDMEGKEKSCIIEKDKIDRLDLPKEGTYIRCDVDKAKNYLWNKEWELIRKQLQEVFNMKPIFDEISKSYCMVIRETMNDLAEQLTEISHTIKESMQIELDYSYNISTIEKYNEVIDDIDVTDIDNNNYAEAA
ncbi:DUF6575 domain-containing protein [Anaerotignum faecicola]